MPSFLVSPKHNCARLGELKDMNNIQGEFFIKGLENLVDVNEANMACLDKKRNISSLRLEWDPRAASSSIDEEVLESLKPSVKLASLQISGFKGPSYPSWLVDQSFSRLGTIELELCEKWISLPPLGQLQSLKSLYVSKARAVEYIGSEFFSGGFPQLEELTLACLYNWKSWCVAKKGVCPKLKKLSIERCGNLESLSLINLGAPEDISISSCHKLRCISGNSLELPQLQLAKTIKINDTHKVRRIEAHFSTAAPSEDAQRFYLEDVVQREAEYTSDVCYHIRRLTVTRCSNLTSLPLGSQSASEYVKISTCPLFQLWDAEQLPPALQVFCIHGNLYKRKQCSRDQHLPRLKQILQCSNKQGGDCKLYLVFRHVHDASKAADFCPKIYREIDTWEVEWDCCTNDTSKFVDSVTEEVPGKLHHPPAGDFWHMWNLKKLVIQGYSGSRFASSFWDPTLCSLSTITFQQCSKCKILPPLGQLRCLRQLFVEGASSLEIFTQDYDAVSEGRRQEAQTRIAFPRLLKLEFHDMPVWKEWLGTKEGDFTLLRKLILKHCPKLRALPHLPPSLEELELEACHELTSLSIFDSNHTKSLILVKPLPRLSLSATNGAPPILQRMSLTNCPLLLTWCEGHSRILADIPNLLIDGIPVHTSHEKSIRSQIKRIRENGGVSHA